MSRTAKVHQATTSYREEPAKPPKYLECRRLQRLAEAVGRRMGRQGDALADPPPMGTPREELAAIDLYLSIPKRYRRGMHDMATQICRAICVGGHHD